ncbi:hypothetical protein [Oxalicibacterium flavum]|nr:hypothetical protein [Oxalicibacterium flavum]
MLWLLLIVVGFNSTFGLSMHEAMHLEHEHTEVDITQRDVPVHRDLAEDDGCASCHAFAQLSLTFVPRPLEKPEHDRLVFATVFPCSVRLPSLWYAYPSGLDPPAAIA